MTPTELIETLERLEKEASTRSDEIGWFAAHVVPELLSALKERERLRDALTEARACIADWGSYAGEYFQKKHDLLGDLAKIDAALQPQGEK